MSQQVEPYARLMDLLNEAREAIRVVSEEAEALALDAAVGARDIPSGAGALCGMCALTQTGIAGALALARRMRADAMATARVETAALKVKRKKAAPAA